MVINTQTSCFGKFGKMANGVGVWADGDSNMGSIKKFNRTQLSDDHNVLCEKLMGIVEGTDTLEALAT
jgi:hypothetical protein